MARHQMGRPPLPKAQQKQVTLSVRLTLAEKRELDERAKADGAKLSTWARQSLVNVKKPRKPSAA